MKREASLLSIIALYAFVLAPLAAVWAQDVTLEDGDITAPLIQHDPPEMAASTGQPLEIMAVITDETAVKEVNLFYRAQGNTEYFSVNMALQGDDIYQAVIPQDDVVEPGLEYYIQASDTAGNVVLRGFSFEPLIITVTPFIPELEDEFIAEAPIEEEPLFKTEGPKTKPWYKKWWVWTIAGGVVIVAAAAGSGGGGGAGGEPTGIATVTGPIP